MKRSVNYKIQKGLKRKTRLSLNKISSALLKTRTIHKQEVDLSLNTISGSLKHMKQATAIIVFIHVTH